MLDAASVVLCHVNICSQFHEKICDHLVALVNLLGSLLSELGECDFSIVADFDIFLSGEKTDRSGNARSGISEFFRDVD